jgi:5-methylcytosine-specific restriction enzyme subunit McrC
MRLFEWHNQSFKQHLDLRKDFIAYLSTVWANRNRYVESEEEEDEEERQEELIQKQRFFDFTTDGLISARNFVGVVQYDDIRIEIYPKIFANDPDLDASRWQLNLLYWLSYCRKINFPFSFADLEKIKFDDFLELLIYIFAHYTQELLSSQPYQNYTSVTEGTTYLQGRLEFDQYIKNNLITGKWQNFYCTYMPFVYDNTFNRIVKYVTRQLVNISRNERNKEQLNAILYLLDDVTDIKCTPSDCDKVKLNPLYADLQNVLELCRLYLSDQVIHLDAADNRNFCFLVPMEYVFEEFTYGFINEKWPALGLSSQSRTHLAETNGKTVFQIKNDIYIKDRLIIDTKYKIRYKGTGLKAGVSQSDLYQMIAYALRRGCKNVLLIYPSSPESINQPVSFEIPAEDLDSPIVIAARSLDITFYDISSADEMIADRVRTLNDIFL